MRMRVEYVVVAPHGRDGRDVAHVRFRGITAPERLPVPPEHLYRPGSGRTLCRLTVDETWETFPACAGVLSDAACADCRTEFVTRGIAPATRISSFRRPAPGA